ncbi:tetratricopeptide repeat protein [Opitutae bacterium]|nr:tetratricopeptide repeat protein [Opitutae bacterium]
MAELWNDPQFQKEFTASYGTLAGYEPPISEEEKSTLRTLIKVIKARPEQAIKQLSEQITADDSAAFDFILANLYFQESDLVNAEKFYDQAIKKYPAFRRAYKNLGFVHIQSGDYISAINSISKSMELGDVDGRAYGLLAYSYLTQENYYPAEAAYRQAILMQPETIDWKLGLARCLLEMGEYSDAVAIFESLIKDDPDNTDYWILQSNAYLGSDESLKAARNLEVVQRLDKADIQTLSLLGDIYMNNEMPDLALNAYLLAADLAENKDLKVLIKSAKVLTLTVNYDQAESIITKIRKDFSEVMSDADDLELLTYEAKIARAKGQDDLAASLLIQIIERDLLNGEAIIELAKYYADQGKLSEAITRFEQAQKIRKYERPALVAHAQTLVNNKEYDEALPLLNRALRIESDRNLKDYKDRVERAARKQ